MADPTETIENVILWIKRVYRAYEYVHEVCESGEMMQRLLRQTNDVAHTLEWLRDRHSKAVDPKSPQKELLALYELNDHGWAEGPTIRRLRALLEELEHKLRPVEPEEQSKLSPEKRNTLVTWKMRPDGPKDWDIKAMTNSANLTDGKVRHKSFKAHLHSWKLKFARAEELKVAPHVTVRQLMFPFQEEDIKKDLDELQTHCNTIHNVVTRVTADSGEMNYENGLTLIKTTEKLHEKAEFDDFGKIAQWISPLTFTKAYDDILDPLVGPTINSDWLIKSEAFQHWNAGRPWRLFVLGDPGSGKSLLAAHIIHHLEGEYGKKRDTAVLYLFLRYQEQKTQTLQSLLSSLLRQLVVRYGAHDVPEEVQILWRQGSVGSSRPPTQKVKELLAMEMQKLARVYIVVDGLDEGSDDTRKTLVDELSKLAAQFNSSHSNGKVSLFFTSRPLDQEIKQTWRHCDGSNEGQPCTETGLVIFYKCRNSQEHGHHYYLCTKCATRKVCSQAPHELVKLPHDRLNVTLVPPDSAIREFVQALLDREQSFGAARRASIATDDSSMTGGFVLGATDETTALGRLLHHEKGLREQITNAVVENARGLYMLAALQFKQLHGSDSRTKVARALESLPQELDDSYRDTLERMVGRDVTEDKKRRAKRVVLWASHARRLLTLSELTAAMAVEDDEEGLDQQEIIARTRGLVVVGSDMCVRLVHRTAAEYLNKPEVQEKWFPDAQEYIAMTCLKTLTNARLREPAHGSEEDKLIAQRMREHPFASYASQHWGFHAQSCQTDPTIAQHIQTLLEKDQYLFSSVQMSAFCEQDQPTGWAQRHGINSLHVAAWFGLESTFSDLVAKKIDVNGTEKNSRGRTPLIYACLGGRAEAVRQLLALEADINGRDVDKIRGWPPLVHAALTEKASVMQVLCSHKDVDVNLRLPPGGTAVLLVAAKRGYVPEVKALLRRPDIDVNVQDQEGFTALNSASRETSVETVQALLAVEGIDIHRANNSHLTPLHSAAWFGQDKIVEVLLEHGADPDARDYEGGTPLRRAIDHGQLSVVEVFKGRGLLPLTATEDGEGKNLLFSAAVNGQASVTQDLLSAGFEVNSRATNGRTPLHDVAGNPRLPASNKLEVVKVLLGAGVDKTLEATDGHTAADLAYDLGQFDIGDLLNPTPGGSSRHIDEKDLPATSLARRGLVEILETMPDEDVLKPDTENETPLAIAIYSQKYDCVEHILSVYDRQKQSIDVPSVYNRTPLHEAARSTQAWLVKKLLAHRPMPAIDRVDNLGSTAMMEAIDSGSIESVIALIEVGGHFTPSHRPTGEMLTQAVEGGKFVVIKSMLEAGVDVMPSHRKLAREKGEEDVIRLLDDHDDML